MKSHHQAIPDPPRDLQALASILDAAGDDEEGVALAIDAFSRTPTCPLGDLAELRKLVPGVANRPIVLDALIEGIIRARSRRGEAQQEIVESLKRSNPDLLLEIDASAALGELMGTTSEGHTTADAPSLPLDLGPATPSGSARYALRERINAGAQGEVFLGVDRLLSTPDSPAFVAVKFLHAGRTEQPAAAEAHRARRISHPNVIRVLDRGVSADGRHYQVYEFLDGGDLEQLVKRGDGLDDKAAAVLVRDIAQGVQAIHTSGVLHCDLKPSNILFARNGEAKIADFGIAQTASAWGTSPESPTHAKRAPGAIGFAPPEQVLGTGPLDATADTYALGAILCWCLTAQAPNGRSPFAALDHLSQPASPGPVNPDAVRAIKDPDLAAICSRAMDRLQTSRYQSAAALAGDLERFLHHETIPFAPGSRLRRLKRWFVRERTAATTILAASVLVAAAGAWAGWSHSRAAVELERRSVATATASIEKAKTNSLKERVSNAILAMQSARQLGVTDQWLTQMTMLDSLMGPTFDLASDAGREMWTQRAEVALQRTAEFNEGGVTVSGLYWQLVAGYWLARAERFDEADKLLESNAQRWSALGVPARDLAALADVLRAAAVVLNPDQGAPGDAVNAKWRWAVATLANYKDSMPEMSSGTGVRGFIQGAKAKARIPLSGGDPQAGLQENGS